MSRPIISASETGIPILNQDGNMVNCLKFTFYHDKKRHETRSITICWKSGNKVYYLYHGKLITFSVRKGQVGDNSEFPFCFDIVCSNEAEIPFDFTFNDREQVTTKTIEGNTLDRVVVTCYGNGSTLSVQEW